MKEFNRPLVSQTEALALVAEWSGRDYDGDKVDQIEQRLTKMWYKKLREDDVKFFEIYKHDANIYNTLKCWRVMSHGFTSCAMRAIDAIEKTGNMKLNSIVDFGGGCGFASLAFKRKYPDKKVAYVDLKSAPGFGFARWLYEKEGANIAMATSKVAHKLGQHDVLVSFENFEHFESPADELDKLVEMFDPKVIIYTGSFTQDATGHFDEYFIDGKSAGRSRMPSKFKAEVVKRGFEEVPFKFWNGRPLVFRKSAK